MITYRLFFVMLLALGLTACSNNNGFSDINRFMAAAKARPRGKIEPLPKFKTYKAFTYSASNRRAPFTEPVTLKQLAQRKEVVDTSNIKPDFDRPKEILESFSLSSLKMVGTLRRQDSKTLWGLIIDSQGDIHRIKIGQHLGKNFGKVTAISQSQIDLMEIVPNGHGGWFYRPRSMILADNL